MRALGFCVSVAHAEYMAGSSARRASRPARSSGETPARRAASGGRRAARRRGQRACSPSTSTTKASTCPYVDTVLFLRPTQSATIFLQQLGRGLRRAPGQGRADGARLHRAAPPRVPLRRPLSRADRVESSGSFDDIEQGFPYLPSGCRLILDRVAQRSSSPTSSRASVAAGRRSSTTCARTATCRCSATSRRAGTSSPTSTGVRGESWTALRRDAGFPTRPAGPREDELLRRVGSLVHVDDIERASTYTRLMLPGGPRLAEMSPRRARAWRTCSSTRSGRTSAATPPSTTALRDAAQAPGFRRRSGRR